MADYNKQTVANLRALLKDRGIPSTGLTRKAQIIERLEQHDAEAQLESADDAEPGAREEPSETQPAIDTAPAGVGQHQGEDGDVEPRKDGGGARDHTMTDAPDNATDDKAAEPSSDGQLEQPAGPPDTSEPKVVDAPLAKEESQKAPQSAKTFATQSHEALQQGEAQASLTTKDSSLNAPSDSQNGEARARKRRSVTPSVDVETTRKRLKLDDDQVATVHLKEDGPVPEVEMQDAVSTDTGDVDEKSAKQVSPIQVREDAEVASSSRVAIDPQVRAPTDVNESQRHEENDQTAAGKAEQVTDDGAKNQQEEVDGDGEPSRPHLASPKPHKEARFQSLLPPAGENSRPTEHPDPAEDDDRVISPALHPATRGLYIRNFMRPLQPASLKNHLISIASPPSSSEADPKALELFHLDPIRTHVLALFDSVTTAARVRSSLHEAVWPPERSRKPLWADFVPDDKVSEWIELEERESGGSSRMSKRWEVVYEPADVDGGVRASHREVGAPSSQQPTRGLAEPTAEAASPPRVGARPAPPDSPSSTARRNKAAAPSGPATEKSFVALDKLFDSTAAKPKLYYLPVAADLAARRLDELRRCSSHNWRPSDRPGAGAERRYTFDDGDVLVDAGPDAEGVRGRGAVRFRAGGGPGGPRGGGGFRDRGWGVQTGMGGPPTEAYGRRRW